MDFDIESNSYIFLGCKFDCKSGLTIKKNSVINNSCRIDPRGGVFIGENVSISQDVVILTADHDLNTSKFDGRTGKVVIEDYVWIGTRATILKGLIIGKGAVIAAGSIVTKDIEPYTVVAGIPAKVIGRRSIDLSYKLNYKRLFQ
ncbi:acyltransferase [Spirosoma sp. 48-14]|uniref:acyltransferase n=1 Tax=Spirosoma sp. 48-14 TaxID=1895854 RepID=UPI0025E96C87|nr:acyltransferase [Spirosoma sp. 48-14]